MPPIPPPHTLPGTPARHRLAAGTQLWRVHRTGSPAVRFEAPQDRVFGGRRFDGTTTTGFGYLYASEQQATAIAERVVPEFDASPTMPRFLARSALAGETVSAIRTTRELELLRLTTAEDLAAIGQDHWLITERDGAYPAMREWAAWLRAMMPWAQGILWTSMPHLPHTTLVLFADRCAGAVEELSGLGLSLDSDQLGDTLALWGIQRRRPARPAPVVFLNYRHGDADAAVLMLHNELSARFGEQGVFRATTSIPLGTYYPDALLENAGKCRVLLAVIGRNWEIASDSTGEILLNDKDDWVRREILEAWSHGATVVPVLVGTRQRLRATSLPEELQQLAFTQFLHLPTGAGVAEVAVLVDKLVRTFPELNDEL